jgi:hypothetical protein
VTVDHFERSRAKQGVEAGVVAVLHPREPLVRAVASEVVKIHCDHLVDRLRLAIRLRMESHRQIQLESYQREQLGPKFTHEDRIPVTDDGVGHPV